MNNNWTLLFQNHILARGFTYFYNEAVENLIITGKAVSATVEGSDTYTVKIGLGQGRVKSMFCTCPYAEDRNHCKRRAAVLYAWEKSNEAVGTAKETTVNNAQPQQEKSVAEIVENADVSVVKKFLVSLLEENDDLLLRFKAAVTKKLTKADMKRLKAHVNQVARRHMDRFGFINYYAAGDFANDLNGIIEKDVRYIMKSGSSCWIKQAWKKNAKCSLYTKSPLDLISGIPMVTAMDVGVLGSTLFTLFFQGGIILLAEYIAPYLSETLIKELICTGSLMILAIGLNMLELTKLKVLNYLPGLLVVPLALKLMQVLGL